MNEQVLQAILNLLVASVKIDGFTLNERDAVENFLKENLKGSAVKKYLQQFDDLVSYTTFDPKSALEVCHDINLQLNRHQKLVVLIHLIELGIADFDYTLRERSFGIEVANALYIEKETLESIQQFVTVHNIYQISSANVLLIDSQPDLPQASFKHYHKPNLGTPLAVLRLPEDEMYFLRVGRFTEEMSLNGKVLNPSFIYPLGQGSVIRSEKAEPIYFSTVVASFVQSEHRSRISFEVQDVNFYFKSGKQGLHHIHLAEESGKLIALMGASGSGKSTLLNVLNGNATPQEGRVLLNGLDIHRQKDEMQGVIGYVPQDDLLIEELSVYENLYFAARLCFSGKSAAKLDELVFQTLKSLGLWEARNLRVGNVLDKTISGGQRKRVNIGLELLREPAMLFVDEPTSGLSSKDSQNIMDLLKELALEGRLIFVVIHQPSSDIFKLFDKLIILDKGGYQIYYGNPVEAVTYFKSIDGQINAEQAVCSNCGNVNPEQIFDIIESRTLDEYGRFTDERKYSPQEWAHYFNERIPLSQVNQVTEKPLNTLRIPNRITQWWIFALRDWLSKLSNRQYLAINLIQAPLLGLILGYVVRYYKVDELTGKGVYVFGENLNVPAFIFMSIIVILFMGLTLSAEEIIKDLKILKREKFLSLSRNSYLLAKIGILFTFSALQSLLYVSVGNAIVGIQNMFFTYWMVLFSCGCFANMLGLNISQTFKSVITIYILIPILLIPQLILGGIVVKFDQVNPDMHAQDNTPLVGDLMVSRWAFEALMVSQFCYNDFEKEFYEIDRKLAYADYKKNYYIPTLQSKLDYCIANLQNPDEKLGLTLDLLRNEIEKERKLTPIFKMKLTDALHPARFSLLTGQAVADYLNLLTKVYTKLYNQSQDERDALIGSQTRRPEEAKAFLARKQAFQNEQVENLVTNRLGEERIVEYKGKLVHKIYPIFFAQGPQEPWWDFRSHFYAPEKQLFGRNIPTLYFNTGVIWLMSLVLYLTLYFRTFKQLFSLRQYKD
jgi:ABC-type multidrug transport system ATPase subunit